MSAQSTPPTHFGATRRSGFDLEACACRLGALGVARHVPISPIRVESTSTIAIFEHIDGSLEDVGGDGSVSECW